MNVLQQAKHLNLTDLRIYIDKLEAAALEGGQKIDIPIQHHFSNNVYAREMRLPAGTLVVGKIHRFSNLNILSEGECSVLSQDGLVRIKAPHTFIGTPGTKRVIVAHTPITWTTIHGTSETDLDKIEEKFIAKNYTEITEDLWLGSSQESRLELE